MSTSHEAAYAQRLRLTEWLLTEALPVWSTVGVDEKGGFYERIDGQRLAVPGPRRLHTVCRQIYSFGAVQLLGGNGESLVTHGLDFLQKMALPEGFFAREYDPSTHTPDAAFDLYRHSFVLFALATAADVLPHRRNELAHQARDLRERLRRTYAHPIAGFEESQPPVEPLKSNPHMHLLEASLAWEETGPLAGDDGWARLSDELAELALRKFRHANGAVREYFTQTWEPMPDASGTWVEPGHQFEWAWLLVKWGKARYRPDALNAARRMADIGELYGTDPRRGVAFNVLLDTFATHDTNARLWPQTERIKAWIALAELAQSAPERDTCLQNAALAATGLWAYLSGLKGLWRDVMRPDGTFADDPSPATSLYHIVCAILELQRIPKPLRK